MRKTLLQSYLDKTTFKQRNSNPREEGIIATISDMVEREGSFENLPKALPKIHEFHKLWIDKSTVKDEEELEKVATMFDLCFSMMVINKEFSRKREESNS
ncbi:hypothetical protein [Burkholderia vietnamiensis]|uniref:hypothetical protein n=1 Tax=Burkholderia vietnamiensis TaxID=60552 RepID=UPI0015941824|nr:hypothetical protein [Burkholderia vietnamiensis]